MLGRIFPWSGTIVNVAQGTYATTNNTYAYWDMASTGFRHLSFDTVLSNNTVTIDATNSSYDTADGSKTWFDVTAFITGASSITASGSYSISDNLPWQRMRLRMQTTHSNNSIAARMTLCD